MKKLLLFTLSFLVLVACQSDDELKYLNKDLSVDERVDDLMKRMTLEEKVAQMTQFVGLNYITDADRNMTAERRFSTVIAEHHILVFLKEILPKWLVKEK